MYLGERYGKQGERDGKQGHLQTSTVLIFMDALGRMQRRC